MGRTNGTFLATAIALFLAASARAAPDGPFEERALGSVPAGLDVKGGIEFSLDGAHVAYVGKKDDKDVPVIDAKTFDAQWWVSRPSFSADGRVAFRIVKAPEKRSDEFDFVGTPQFSADGTRLAFGVLAGRDFAWKVLALE